MGNFLAQAIAEPFVAFLILVILPGGLTLLTIGTRLDSGQSIPWVRVATTLLVYTAIGVWFFKTLSTEVLGEELTRGVFLARSTPSTGLLVLTENELKLPDRDIPQWSTSQPTTPAVLIEDNTPTPPPKETPIEETKPPQPPPSIVPPLSDVPDVESWCLQGSLRITRVEPNARKVNGKQAQDILIWGGAHDTTGFHFDRFFVEARRQDDRPSLDHIERWNPIIKEFREQLGSGGKDQLLATWHYEDWQTLFGADEDQVVVWIRVAGVDDAQGNGRSIESACFVRLELTR